MPKIDHINLLLAEDEYLLRQSLARKITEIDPVFRIAAECGDGKSALKMLEKENIHAVFTDIRMPEMDGLELARRVRERYPAIITVILSGYAEFEYAKEALRQNVFDYLLKPVTEEDLERLLSALSLKLQQTYTLPEEEGLSTKGAKEAVEYTASYLTAHFREEVDLGELAERFGFSSAYLSRSYAKEKGESPMKTLTRLRMQEAKRLLATTTEPIARVGELVGYPDQFYFSRTFRKEVGENPTAYRKKYMEE